VTRYWCCWCGSTVDRPGDGEYVSCKRCDHEFRKLLGFGPVSLMFPLKPGQDPGLPAASRKRFRFRNARTGEFVGITDVAAVDPEAAPSYRFRVVGTYSGSVEENDDQVTVRLSTGPAGRETLSGTLTMTTVEWAVLSTALRRSLPAIVQIVDDEAA
jgi:hypothetical protein